MVRYHLSPGAEAELGEILDWSERRFGAVARDRYAALILAALRNLADNPRQSNVRWRRVRKTEIGVYHIEYSRDRVPADFGRVGEPRHYVVFSLGPESDLQILGFVHDSMLLDRVFRRLVAGKR